MATSGGCIAHCPSHTTSWSTGEITSGTVISYRHFQEINDAIHAERKRRYADSTLSNYTYTENVSSGNIITNNTISRFKKYIDELRNYNPVISADQPSTANPAFDWYYINYYNTSDYTQKVVDQEILANSLLELRTKVNDLNNDCVCNCNYCTCVCNYCQCNCSYCQCNCSYTCTCDCNYSCTCNCNYSCTCNCNYSCTCNCNYCQCNCSYTTCSCNRDTGC